MLYKTLLFLGLSFGLCGCAEHAILKKRNAIVVQVKEQSTGPLPCLTLLPSKQALDYKEVYPERLSQQIRFSLASFPKKSKFWNIKFITLDYGEEVVDKENSETKKAGLDEDIVKENNINQDKHYYLNLCFYYKNPSLGGQPAFKGQIRLERTKIRPVEAFNLLTEHLIEDIAASSLPEISVKMYQ